MSSSPTITELVEVPLPNGDGKGGLKLRNCERGDTVFVCVDLGLAESMRSAGFPAICNFTEGAHLKEFVERRAAIVTMCGRKSSMAAETVATHLETSCYPEKIGVLDMDKSIGFVDAPERFHDWFAGEVEAGEFSSTLDFIITADVRAKPRPKWTPSLAALSNGDGHQTDLEKEIDRQLAGYRPKTFGQIVEAVGEMVHLWPNWLIIGHLSLIYSKPKQGKTRIYIAWIKALWFGERWPDGADNQWPAGTKTIILPYDRNHQEIAAEMKRMGITDEAALCPHDPRDETGVSLLSITEPLMLAILDKILTDDKAIKLIVVDTLTYASEKSLSKPEDMKAILDAIITLAIHYAVAVLVLIHENREGEALGRRICERARVLMRLERYSESDPTRLRLYVKESNFKERPALAILHTDAGIVFEKDAGQTGNTADRRDACARWLVDFLWKRGVKVEVDYGTLINSAGEAGYAGELSATDQRWTNRKLLDRAIKAINEEVEALAEFHVFKIHRREQPRPGRAKPVVYYWLEVDGQPANNDAGTPL